jgi:hypothetical protein
MCLKRRGHEETRSSSHWTDVVDRKGIEEKEPLWCTQAAGMHECTGVPLTYGVAR